MGGPADLHQVVEIVLRMDDELGYGATGEAEAEELRRRLERMRDAPKSLERAVHAFLVAVKHWRKRDSARLVRGDDEREDLTPVRRAFRPIWQEVAGLVDHWRD